MLKRLITTCAIFTAAAALAAAPSLSGKWVFVSKDTPHGELRMDVSLTQHERGNQIKGEMVLFGTKVTLEGEAADASFTLKGRHHNMELTLTGKLKTDGTIEGFLSTEQGDLTYTGTRAK